MDSDQVAAAVKGAGVDEATTAAIVDDYEQAQIGSLKAGLLAAALLALVSLAFTRDSPTDHPAKPAKPASTEDDAATAGTPAST